MNENPSPKQEQPIQTLDQISFDVLPWTADTAAQSKIGTEHASASQEFSSHDAAFNLHADRWISHDDKKIKFAENYRFALGDDKGIECLVAEITCLVRPRPNTWEITMQINTLQKQPALKGAGMKIYEKMLALAPQLADTAPEGMPAEHRVARVTDFSTQKPLTDERWNQLFEPVLQKFDYERVEDGKWIKKFGG